MSRFPFVYFNDADHTISLHALAPIAKSAGPALAVNKARPMSIKARPSTWARELDQRVLNLPNFLRSPRAM